MVEIEWEAEIIFRPEHHSLQDFCAEKGITIPNEKATTPLVFLSTHSLDDLLSFLSADTGREHGGVLVGMPYKDEKLGINFVDVQAALPALDSIGSAVHMQFTAQDWTFISGMLAEEFPDRVVVGWFHSHPGLGIFMSGTDAATQRSFFNQPWHLAVVVDPLARISGWFYGPDCIPLARHQIAAYPVKDTSQPQIEAYGSKWRWLLPLFGLFIAGLALGWVFLSAREG